MWWVECLYVLMSLWELRSYMLEDNTNIFLRIFAIASKSGLQPLLIALVSWLLGNINNLFDKRLYSTYTLVGDVAHYSFFNKLCQNCQKMSENENTLVPICFRSHQKCLSSLVFGFSENLIIWAADTVPWVGPTIFRIRYPWQLEFFGLPKKGWAFILTLPPRRLLWSPY